MLWEESRFLRLRKKQQNRLESVRKGNVWQEPEVHMDPRVPEFTGRREGEAHRGHCWENEC